MVRKKILKLFKKLFITKAVREEIIYEALSSKGIDNLWEQAKINRDNKGHTDYTDLAKYLLN